MAESKKKAVVFTNDEHEINGIFRKKRLRSQEVSAAYTRISYKQNVPQVKTNLLMRAEKVKDCGTSLVFRHEIEYNGLVNNHGKLHWANFCRDRFCPMCAWRRSFKYFAVISQIIEKAYNTNQYKFIFICLTVPNCKAEDLKLTLDQMQYAWNLFSGRKKWKDAVRGCIKSLEITYNSKKKSPNYGTYHPHYHFLIAVDQKYASRGHEYISHDELCQMWQSCYRFAKISPSAQFIRLVDMKPDKYRKDRDLYKGNEHDHVDWLKKAVLESAKYAVKDSDYILPAKADTDRVFPPLIDALEKRRTISINGIFNDIRQELGHPDDLENDADLIHIQDNMEISPAVAYLINKYEWQVGIYQLIDMYVKNPSQE